MIIDQDYQNTCQRQTFASLIIEVSVSLISIVTNKIDTLLPEQASISAHSSN